MRSGVIALLNAKHGLLFIVRRSATRQGWLDGVLSLRKLNCSQSGVDPLQATEYVECVESVVRDLDMETNAAWSMWDASQDNYMLHMRPGNDNVRRVCIVLMGRYGFTLVKKK